MTGYRTVLLVGAGRQRIRHPSNRHVEDSVELPVDSKNEQVFGHVTQAAFACFHAILQAVFRFSGSVAQPPTDHWLAGRPWYELTDGDSLEREEHIACRWR